MINGFYDIENAADRYEEEQQALKDIAEEERKWEALLRELTEDW